MNQKIMLENENKNRLSSIENLVQQFNESFKNTQQEILQQFDQIRPRVEKGVEKFKKLINLPNPPATILDLACGTGMASLVLAKQGYDVIGLDCSEEGLKTGKALANGLGLDITWVLGDMRDFELEKHVDFVLLYDVIFGCCNTQNENEMVLKSISSSLKSGGRCLLEVYNKEFATKNNIENVFFYNQEKDWFFPDHQNKNLKGRSMQLFTHEEWEELLTKYQFKIISLGDKGWHWKGDDTNQPWRGEFIIVEKI